VLFDTISAAILADLDSDDCDIAWILDTVRDSCPDAPYDLLEQTVLRIVVELVGRGLAEAHPFCEGPNAVTSAEGVARPAVLPSSPTYSALRTPGAPSGRPT